MLPLSHPHSGKFSPSFGHALGLELLDPEAEAGKREATVTYSASEGTK